jgi:hypothetical protein
VQAKSASEFLELVEILPDWSFGAQPMRLGLAQGWPQFNLDELLRIRHLCY